MKMKSQAITPSKLSWVSKCLNSKPVSADKHSEWIDSGLTRFLKMPDAHCCLKLSVVSCMASISGKFLRSAKARVWVGATVVDMRVRLCVHQFMVYVHQRGLAISYWLCLNVALCTGTWIERRAALTDSSLSLSTEKDSFLSLHVIPLHVTQNQNPTLNEHNHLSPNSFVALLVNSIDTHPFQTLMCTYALPASTYVCVTILTLFWKCKEKSHIHTCDLFCIDWFSYINQL